MLSQSAGTVVVEGDIFVSNGSASVSGTLNTIAKFTPTGSSVGDSSLINVGDISGTGIGLEYNVALSPGGLDQAIAFEVDVDNSGASGTQIAIDIPAFPSATGTAFALRIGGNFDVGVSVSGVTSTGFNGFELSSTTPILSAGQFVRGQLIQWSNAANHTGGDVFGTFYNIDAADPDANESAIRMQGPWDNEFEFEGTTIDAIETFFRITNPTTIDKVITFPNATGTVGFEIAVNQDFDVQAAVLGNPATNDMRLYVDESTDRVGGASDDCALVARLSDGTEINIAILATDAGCP